MTKFKAAAEDTDDVGKQHLDIGTDYIGEVL